MEDLIGKKFRYKGSNDFKIVKEVRNNRVFFTDNGVVDLAKINETFELVQESKPNPDTFFDYELSSNLGGLINQIEMYQKNPSEFEKMSQMERNAEMERGDYQQPIIQNGQDISGLSPETIRWMKEEEEKQKQRTLMKEQALKQDPWMAQFGASGQVRKVDANYDTELEKVQRVNNGEELPLVQNTIQNNTNISPNNALPKMKKTFKVKLNIEINEMIPKVEDIRAVENLFDVSIIDELSKEIANKYLNDRELFENMIMSELEKVVKPKKKVIKKPAVSKKKPIKSNES